ncbi:hypothetical protein BGX28_006636 [Mortierella sp. GBA30]|nr:hypothetical protein BGX28_006636 [Mortierella sp. GBA30]
MYSHSILNTNKTSSNSVFAATSPNASTATARITLVPSEASALLLQSLLLENNITMPTTTTTASAAATPVGNNNTINHDFCLFETDDSSFDYPLFAESIKMQQQQHALRQAATVTTTVTITTNSGGNTNPLCTPQTPSLAIIGDDNPRSGGADSLGFDSLATLFDERSNCSNNNSGLNGDVLGHVINMGMDGNCGVMAQHHQSLVNTPFTSYLDTPYETPYLGDFGFGNDECTSATEVLFGGFDAQSVQDSNGNTLLLFSGYDFSMPAFEDVASTGLGNTIEPATLLMASPAQQDSGMVQSSPADSDGEDGMSSASTRSSPSQVGTFDDASEEGENTNGVETGLEEDSSSPSISSVVDDIDSDFDDECQDNDNDDGDDDEFIPSRPLAAAVSSFKRKALASFAAGRCNTETDVASFSTIFKRTRPELASPCGGNTSSKKKRSTKAKTSGPAKRKAATKRFSCIHAGCERRFARLFNLHTHEKTHDPHQVRPFVCSVLECSKRFSRKHDLQRHEASVHKGERNYGCPTCGKPFSRQDGLRRHLSLKGNNGSNACAFGIVDGKAGNRSTSSLSSRGNAAETETGWSAT